ncbi:MAG: nucleotidyltransferase domain-containing protein [Actinobacteria bacterium]|nr:nucleotidyltransferase domain-containing protein [Actinomycetota bacterium]
MTELDLLAFELSVSGRTLRRAAGRGAIRAAREGERRVQVSDSEADYLRAYWPLLSALIAELRTLPDVRLAVVFGSAARGELYEQSDLDLLIRFAHGGLESRSTLIDRLEEASRRTIQLVAFDETLAAPLLLADVLRDGRVLVDRDGDWPRLKRRERLIQREAAAAEARLSEEIRTELRELGAVG